MRCPSCSHENRAGRKFCVECGAALALACAACSAPYEAGEKFCGECGATLGTAAPRQPVAADGEGVTAGAPIARAAADAGARKVVTIVFADLVGSTALHERLDAESARRVMERYYEALRAAVDAHGGVIVKLLGDGVMAAFGLRQVAEDDALRAVRTGAAMQDAFRALIRVEAAVLGAVGLRVAVNTGEVVVSGARDDVIGDPVNVAARLQEQGGDGDVVLGDATRRLVATRVTLAPLGSITLKGRAEAVAAYRLVSLDPPAGATAAPFVGRDAELTRLEAVYAAAVTTPATRLVVLLGSPGLGKSRLIDELAQRHLEDATILAAHCDAAGGATFAPLAQAVRALLGLADGAVGEPVRAAVAAALPAGDESERARVAGGIAGLLGDAATSPEETFFVVRRFLAGLAGVKPLVLVIDDLHWAEPLLLDLVEHLVQWGGGVPLFVLVGARPELRELRSSLAMPGGLVSDVVTLGGLDAGAATRLAANVIGAADLPAAVAAKVLATSEGNPLFVGELVRMLVQEGALTKDGERWIVGAGLAAFEMPPTIHALLAARIERLRPEERTVLERASVVGRHFSRSAVAALLGRNGSELDARLEALQRGELIERDTGWLLGEPVMRFHHVLIRDAAYRRLLKGTRAELHGRLADWIEARVGDAPEHDEMIGWHLEQAHHLLHELGPLDAAAVALGERAARRLAAAGRRALARDDVSLAAGLLGRALDRLGSDASERADLVLDWCEALLSAGDVGPAAAAIDELERVAADSPRLRAWHTCFAGQLTVLTAPEALHATSERVGAAARELAALDDAAGEAKAHFVHAQALARLGKVGACEAALDQALAAARRAGDRRRANAVLAGAPLAALWGPSPVTRASGRCLDVVRVLRITQGAPAVEAVALSCQGVLEALRGRTEAARRMLASSRTMVEELGISHRLYESDVFAGRIDLLEGDAPAAERALRAGYEGLRDLGLGIDAARAAALLGRALLAQDRAAEAETLSHESELLAGDDLQAAIAWRGVRAEALARRGDHATAITLAEAAVAIAAATDALLDHADARLALAAAFRAGGRRAEADAEERRAFELWEAKGATVLAERARQSRPPIASLGGAREDRVAFSRPVPRRVHANAASALAARFEAAFTAGDADAVAALWTDSLEVVDHANGATYDRDGHLASIRRLRRARDPKMSFETLATLGASICLTRRRITSKGTVGGRLDVGESEHEVLVLFEVDEPGSCHRIEIFAADHLGDAIARLYQRYAEGFPQGPERERAAVVARAVALMLTSVKAPHDLTELYAPTYQDVDHRRVGYGSLSFDESKERLPQSFTSVADDMRFHVDDVLALDPNGFVRKTTATGVWRDGGGPFERTVCTLSVFGPDGRVTNHETFEPGREAEVLARFDALTGAAAPERGLEAAPRARARVRPNAVTRASAEFEGIVAARDFAALETLFAEDAECIEHPTGATYGVEAMRTGIRRLMQSPDARLRFIPLATLGPSWTLVRREMSASGSVGGHFDVGAYEIVDVAIYGTDERGRIRHCEIFATERLRGAVARLYERYAESLPDGPARTRASGAARVLATFDGPLDADRIARAYAPSCECVDHRTLGTWSARGIEEWLKHWRGQTELVDGFTVRDDEVLALEPAAILRRETFSGSGRASGGTVENVVLGLHVFGADGRIVLTEAFEPDQEAEALARFDALTAAAAPQPPVRRRVRPNTATRTFAAIQAAFARRDLAAIDALLGDPLETIEHPTGTTYGRDGQLESSRRMMRVPGLDVRIEPLATLGDSLCLARRIVNASGTAGGRFDVGEYEIESIVLNGVDAAGRLTSAEVFASNHLCQATARLYALHAESLPDGPERTRAAGIASSHAVWEGPLDSDRAASFVSVVAPSYVCIDHRSLGTWSAQGREEWLQHWRGQAELAVGFSRRDDDILAFAPHANVTRVTYFGTNRATGGPFENVFLALNVFGEDGLYTRCELFEPDHEAEALARFDALIGSAPPASPVQRRVRPNAATATAARLIRAVAARDTDELVALHAGAYELVHHPTRTVLDREKALAWWRLVFTEDRNFTLRLEVIATLGERLLLARSFRSASAIVGGQFDAGAYEHDTIGLSETDGHGVAIRTEVFAVDRLGDAIARLYARYAEQLSDGPEGARAAMRARAATTMLTRSTEYRLEDVCTPDLEAVDHRSVGMGAVTGSNLWSRWRAASDELMQDQTYRVEDVLALGADGLLRRTTETGNVRASGGAFENSIWILSTFGPDGRQARIELFDLGREAEALARFDALLGSAGEATPPVPMASRFTNAATRLLERFVQSSAERDWQSLADLFAPSLRFDDRRPLLRLQLPKESFLEQHRVIFDVPNGRWITTTIATRGERLVLARMLFQGDVAGGGGALEIDHLAVLEVGADGRSETVVLFEPADLDAAYTELDARYENGEAVMHGPIHSTYVGAMATRDWRAMAAACAPTLTQHDHRSVAVLGTVRGAAAWVQTSSVLVDLAPDTRVHFDHIRHGRHSFLWEATQHGSREGGRFELRYVGVTELDDQGMVARIDIYDPEALERARRRFEEVERRSSRTPSAEPFANAASATAAPVTAAIVAHDWRRFAELLADDFRMSDRRRVVQLEFDRDRYVAFTRELADGRTIRGKSELLATRGERLALNRSTFVFSDADVGPSEIAFLILVEVDQRGPIVAYVRWDVEDLDAAYAELDARYEAVEEAGPAAFMRLYREAIVSRDWEPVLARCAPTIVEYDHRTLAVLGTTRGAEAWVQNFRTLTELSPDAVYRVEHFRTGARGFWSVGTWHGTREGGAYEIPISAVLETDEQGRVRRADIYDPEQIDQARARFAELAAPAPSAEPFANAATRALERGTAALGARDWQGFAALFVADFRFYDRTSFGQFEANAAEFLAGFRQMVEMTSGTPTRQVLATRGARLALGRFLWRGAAGDVGPSEVEWLLIVEADDRGDHLAVVWFNPNDLDAAYAELDARWRAGEGVEYGMAATSLEDSAAAVERRDWDAAVAMYAPTLVGNDHRLAGWGTLHGPTAILEAFRAMFALAPDARYRTNHLRATRRGYIAECVWVGTRDGGAFESPFLAVAEFDATDRPERLDFYDPPHAEAAWARFEEIGADTVPPLSPVATWANAATGAMRRATAAFASRDWERFSTFFGVGFQAIDRRALMQLELDREQWLASYREIIEMTTALPTREVLATRGDRLALVRLIWEGAAGAIGPSEIEWLLVIEVDMRGHHSAVVTFDPSDLDAAYAELDARWRAGEETEHPRVAAYQTAFERRFASRDWDALATLFAPALVAHDHRLVGWDTLRGPAAFVGAFRALVDLAPDVRVRVDHMRMSARGMIGEVAWVGTRDGGAFESPFINVVELDADGKAARLDLYDPHHLEAALARFDEIGASAAREPLAAIVEPNAAAATMERWQAAFEAGLEADDWGALRGLCAPGMVFEDRQRLALVSGDTEMMIASARERVRTGARPEARLVGAAGDRVVIVRMLWSGGPPGGRFEIEYLSVVEVDEAGLLTAIIFFDLDAARAAQREAWARWAAIDSVAVPWVALVGAAADAFDAHDRERCRAILADDIVVEDNRRTGIGRIEGAGAYLDSLTVLWDLAPDQRVELGRLWPAVERHGVVISSRRFGTLADGGAFESEHLWLGTATGGRITRLELFETEDLDKAVARLAELRSDPLRIPPNAAARAYDRWYERATAGDWDAFQALFDERFRFEDCRRVMRLTGDRDMAVASDRYTWESGWRPTRTLLSTAGDRLVLQRMLWTLSEGGVVSEVELIELEEVDADGRFIATMLFDPDDRAAASAELFERYAASGAEGLPPETIELARAFNAHDLERMRALLPAGFYLDDRRRTGVGRIEGVDAYLRSLAALWELSDDLRSEALYTVASAEHGRLMVAHWFGTNAEGGDFEGVFVSLGLLRGGRPVGVEIFELEDLDVAQARFEALSAETV